MKETPPFPEVLVELRFESCAALMLIVVASMLPDGRFVMLALVRLVCLVCAVCGELT